MHMGKRENLEATDSDISQGYRFRDPGYGFQVSHKAAQLRFLTVWFSVFPFQRNHKRVPRCNGSDEWSSSKGDNCNGNSGTLGTVLRPTVGDDGRRVEQPQR